MFKRGLRTIGELCRFMKLAAQKGWRWIIRTAREPDLFRESSINMCLSDHYVTIIMR
jgi:hypothetical protein